MTISQLPQALNVIDHSLSTKKAAISQAYKATEAREAGFLYKEEFPFFLDILFQYTKYEVTFKKLDTDGDHRISYEEFKANRKAAGLEGDLLTGDAKEEFDNLDLDHGGKILFSEVS